MKKIYPFALLIISVLISSCSKDPDNPSPGTDPSDFEEIRRELTNESIIGTWELYSYTKQVKKGTYESSMRYPEADGFTLTFSESNKFHEANPSPIGQSISRKGTYKIVEGKIEFTYKMKDEAGNETTNVKYRPVSWLSNKRLGTYDKYNDLTGSILVQESKTWRNKENMPDEHPFVDKEDVTKARLTGKWKVYAYAEFYGGHLVPDNDEKEKAMIGEVVEYDNEKATAYTKTEEKAESGPYVIIDDVVHIFYEKNDSKVRSVIGSAINFGREQRVESRKEEDDIIVDATTFWITDWEKRTDRTTGEEFEAFTIFDNSFDPKSGTAYIWTKKIDMKRVE